MKETSITMTVAASIGCASRSPPNIGPKMGSRRIFTPQFKLQVLESYRNDSDCKGNQRATARKYNIHRRQIQKWLQCESNLRSSVANINQNNVKHQFHNISLHHPQPHQPSQMGIRATGISGSHYSHQHNHQQHHQHLSVNPARHGVALCSLKVPSPRDRDGGKSSTTSTQGMLTAANLTVVAAATTGSMSIVNATNSTTKASATTTDVVSPVRPTAIVGSSGRTVSTSSILHPHLPHHHQHHYTMQYTNTPAVPVSVPLLTHHISSHQPLHHYQYHNLSHHPHTATALTQSQTQPSTFLPSVSLPVTILSTAAAKNLNTSLSGDTIVYSEKIKIDELHNITPTMTTTATTIENSYLLHDRYENIGESCREYVNQNHDKKYEIIQQQTLSVAPIDLSLGARRSYEEKMQYAEEKRYKKVQNKCNNAISDTENQNVPYVTNDEFVVDLTFRKRKVVTSTHVNDEKPTKLSKLINNADKAVKLEVEYDVTDVNNHEGDEEVDIDVEERDPPSKPIKLFKPYLLDEKDNNSYKKPEIYENYAEQRDPIIWSHYPTCISPNSCDSRQDSSHGSNFQTPPLEKYYTFPVGSPYFPTSSIILSPTTSTSRLSSPAGLPFPKGSPVSGYESSSSTYSNSSCKNREITSTSKAYSIDLKLHTIYSDNMILNESHIQKWLDQEPISTSQSAANTSIVLCA